MADLTQDGAHHVAFAGRRCKVRFSTYIFGGRTAIQLFDDETGELVCTATANVLDEPLGHNEVLIKNYSENEGVLGALVRAGVVEDTGRRVASGFVTLPVCRLLGGELSA